MVKCSDLICSFGKVIASDWYLNHEDALEFCRKRNGRAISTKDQSTLLEAFNVLKYCYKYDEKGKYLGEDARDTDTFWIGLSKIDANHTLTWSDGSEYSESEQSNLFASSSSPDTSDCQFFFIDADSDEQRIGKSGSTCTVKYSHRALCLLDEATTTRMATTLTSTQDTISTPSPVTTPYVQGISDTISGTDDNAFFYSTIVLALLLLLSLVFVAVLIRRIYRKESRNKEEEGPGEASQPVTAGPNQADHVPQSLDQSQSFNVSYSSRMQQLQHQEQVGDSSFGIYQNV